MPGPDAFSIQQGVSTATAGGLDAGTLPALVDSLDGAAPYVPQFSAVVAGILDNVASLVNPTAPGTFASPFARLSVAEKAVVLGLLESDPAAASLFGILPALVAFLCYSEAGALDPATRTLAGRPVGWEITGYSGPADGRAEFRGYFQNRRRAAGA